MSTPTASAALSSSARRGRSSRRRSAHRLRARSGCRPACRPPTTAGPFTRLRPTAIGTSAVRSSWSDPKAPSPTTNRSPRPPRSILAWPIGSRFREQRQVAPASRMPDQRIAGSRATTPRMVGLELDVRRARPRDPLGEPLGDVASGTPRPRSTRRAISWSVRPDGRWGDDVVIDDGHAVHLAEARAIAWVWRAATRAAGCRRCREQGRARRSQYARSGQGRQSQPPPTGERVVSPRCRPPSRRPATSVSTSTCAHTAAACVTRAARVRRARRGSRVAVHRRRIRPPRRARLASMSRRRRWAARIRVATRRANVGAGTPLTGAVREARERLGEQPCGPPA